MKVSDIGRKHGVSDAAYRKWKSNYGGMEASDLKRVRELETENAWNQRSRRGHIMFNTHGYPGVALSAALAALMSAPKADAAVCTVPDAAYPSIQAALDDRSCETVRVAPGTYTENLHINRRVVLAGATRDSVIVDGAGRAPGISVGRNAFAIITNLTVTNGFNTLDGGGVDGDFDSIVLLNGVRLTNNVARSGAGAQSSAATLIVLNSLVDGNEGGGLSAPPGSGPGRLVVLNTTIENNVLSSPAAVYANNLTLRDSVVRNNAGDDAVWFFTGTMQHTLVADNLVDTGVCTVRISDVGTIETSTISNNLARLTGGVCNGGGQLTIRNSTITGNVGLNEAGGVGQSFIGNDVSINVQYSTIADNEGPGGDAVGVVFGAVLLRASIVAGSTPGAGCREFADGRVVSLGSNVGTDSSCSLIRDSDQAEVGDAGLAPLDDNGGPTPTRALLPGSPALDSVAGGDCPASDQRGVARPQGPACDAGAFEAG